MLTELRISNFAVIEHLSLTIESGFQVFTGETGAGKSILVDALTLLVGARASVDLVRSDAEEAVVEAAFALPTTTPIIERLRETGSLGPRETELIIRRVVSRSGRNRIYVNGNLTPLHVLQSLAGTLIDIHGQHEQQSLLSAQAQLDVLDAFGHLKDVRREYATQYEQWRASQRALEEAERSAAERAQNEEVIRFQYRELVDADVRQGEDEALTVEHHRLSHARRLGELAHEAHELLYAGDAAILSGLGAVRERLRELSSIDPGTGDWSTFCEGATVQLRELAHHLRDYEQGLESDPARLGVVEERLERLQRLKKKHGGSVESLLAKIQELKQQIQELDGSDTKTAELGQRVAEDHARLEALANRLSDARVRAARKLEMKVKEELAALRMDQTRLQIVVEQDRGDSGFGPTGRDRVEYLMSANQGEPLQPLARVASGGELSRVMLAIKTVLAETDGVPVLVFDEVDAGIGGAVAAVMGQRLRALADYHQVFCITHLPQIASQAGTHFLVEKDVVKKRTVTKVRRLDERERREEVARMLGGLAITQAARDTAAELIREVKREL
jgi:DNA repair protein RecN (Recombination protein N)